MNEIKDISRCFLLILLYLRLCIYRGKSKKNLFSITSFQSVVGFYTFIMEVVLEEAVRRDNVTLLAVVTENNLVY